MQMVDRRSLSSPLFEQPLTHVRVNKPVPKASMETSLKESQCTYGFQIDEPINVTRFELLVKDIV
jgi:hypothetical protein